MDPTAATLQGVQALQGALSVITALQLTSYRFPQSAGVLQGESEFDYLVIGGGTAGSVVASRLTEDHDVTVAILETGVEPQLESTLPGTFTVIPEDNSDYNFPTEQDNFSGQYLRDRIVRMTAGKSLGGSSALQHMIMVRGNRYDYKLWANAANDSSWDYDSLLPYFIKSEHLKDEAILNSPTARLHGTEGYVGMTREPSEANADIIKAFEELGYEYYVDLNANVTQGITDPIYSIFDDRRQCTAEAYLNPAKNRSNLLVYTGTTVTKIIFDDVNNAIGVEAINTYNETVTVYARKEVILAAGVMRSPQLLMLSGIGPETELEKFGIPVISDLPVGKGLSDHVGVVVAYTLEKSNETVPPADPGNFPAPTTLIFKALDRSDTYPDYQSINLLFPQDSEGLMQLCANVFKYTNVICNEMYNSNVGQGLMFAVILMLHPYSTGNVTLHSTDPLDNPKIHMGYFTNSTDLDNFGSYLKDFSSIANTTYFKNIGSELVDLDLSECESLERDSWEYWRCYSRTMSSTIWHPVGTAAMGSVLDSRLRVLGVQRLRVVDAAGMPYVTSGNIMPAVLAFAEKGADLIKEDN